MIQCIALWHQRIRENRLRDAFPEVEDPELRRLHRAVASLPALHHEVFRLARFEDLTTDEIAARLGLSRRQARRHFVYALVMLMRSMERQKRERW
ncbi:RNA polymerase sigma factor [Novosphingobium album (ex Liu et al. 2023)]|uniref:Sigma factor-like helix-turn-helix DNA-binding protein n=1 Tax=Novosphingobium album (ex Liu et al. 2023) TaxID=3031130 RepID=A0ABT5WR88_9SPHN|nr:sigma factor-like helix-turn-helix DNA-binding protein [Novosphingobium album (ex Liu et al. 2023)]MDE8652548.1 sigma factor-like helix-turn-helix DNA-binding protein [Novosphingobium album (ex Liu et al. 2023)]